MTRLALLLLCAATAASHATPPAPPAAPAAAEVHAACPDLVEQGLGSVEALAEDMRRHRTLSLWWD